MAYLSLAHLEIDTITDVCKIAQGTRSKVQRTAKFRLNPKEDAQVYKENENKMLCTRRTNSQKLQRSTRHWLNN